MKANFVYIEQRIAMEKLKAGEIDAVIVVGGKPYKSVSTFVNDGRFHLVNVTTTSRCRPTICRQRSPRRTIRT